MEERKSVSMAAVLIVNALVWAGAILMAPDIVGDRFESQDVVMWGIVGFMVANGLLLSVLMRSTSGK